MGLKYEDIKPVFLARLKRDRQATALMSSIESGSATYATATQYAARVGELLGQTLRLNAPITDISDWDIDDLIPGSLGLDHRIVTNACRAVQETMNRDAGIGIRYQEPTFDWDRVHGIVDELRDNPEFINIEETFYDQITNFSQNVVDSSVRANASIASRAGIKTYVIRTASANACQWCQDAAGQYDYESVKNTGDPVWLRHENCNCTIDYVTERNGSVYRERVYEGNNMMADENDSAIAAELSRPATEGKVGVNWPIVQSDNYRESFRTITDNERVADSIYTRASWALNNRDGKETEELYAILTSGNRAGDELSRITDQEYIRAVIRTPAFESAVKTADSSGQSVVLIHNHPYGTPPSLTDINGLMGTQNVSGITVGHNGSVYYYTRPNIELSVDIFEDYYAEHYLRSCNDVSAHEYALRRMSEECGFSFIRLI